MHAIDNPKNDGRRRITIVSKGDFQFSYFCGPGHGGQAKDKVHSGVQIFHADSGATARASDSRSLEQNKRSAFGRLLKTPKMKFFIARRLHEIQNDETIEESVARDMQPSNLRFEVKDADGRWVEVTDEYFNSKEAQNVR